MADTHREVRVLSDPEAVATEAAEFVVGCARRAVSARGRFTIALSGGSTPQRLYELLASEKWQVPLPWGAAHVLWADERCVPPDHPDSNWRMVQESLLSKLSVPPGSVHRMWGEGDPSIAADAHDLLLQCLLGPVPRLDLAVLGMGADGHTASLFPGTAALDETERLVVASYVPALDAWRLTMTYRLLNAAADVVFLVTGAQKAEALRKVLHGSGDAEALPAARVRPADGRVLWLVDEAAAGS